MIPQFGQLAEIFAKARDLTSPPSQEGRDLAVSLPPLTVPPMPPAMAIPLPLSGAALVLPPRHGRTRLVNDRRPDGGCMGKPGG